MKMWTHRAFQEFFLQFPHEAEEEWEQLFPSKAFAAAGLQKKPKFVFTPHEMLHGWILRNAGGELPIDILVNLAKKAGSNCSFQQKWLRIRAHLFEEKNGIVSLAAPPAVEVLSKQEKKEIYHRLKGRREQFQQMKVRCLKLLDSVWPTMQRHSRDLTEVTSAKVGSHR